MQGLQIQVQKESLAPLNQVFFHPSFIALTTMAIVELDARTSDAIAIAVRFNAPIFTLEAIMQEAGIILDRELPMQSEETQSTEKSEFTNLSKEELNEALEKAVEEENYERF